MLLAGGGVLAAALLQLQLRSAFLPCLDSISFLFWPLIRTPHLWAGEPEGFFLPASPSLCCRRPRLPCQRALHAA